MQRGYHYSKGGLAAHILRRIVHLASLLVLWIYYQWGPSTAHFFKLPLPWIVCICLVIILLLESVRLYRGWTVFGQRHYERKKISAFAWGIVAMGLVLLFAPGEQFAVPIIAAYAMGDPLLGELRRTKLAKYGTFIIGVIFISGIWLASHFWLGTPLWYCYFMGVITVAAEWPCLKWIDDNAMMQLIPLIIVLIFTY
jgi:hypothetical protein